MSDTVLGLLKDGWLALLYLFILRVVLVVGKELRGTPTVVAGVVAGTPTPPGSPAPKPTKHSKSSQDQAPPQAASATWSLVVEEPAVLRGHTVVVDQEISIGRGGGCAISLPNDTFVSTVHARVMPREAALWIEDLGSTNGTHVAGHALVAEHRLRVGDELRVGETELRYEE